MSPASFQPKGAFAIVGAIIAILLLVQLAAPPETVSAISSKFQSLQTHNDLQLSEMNSTLGFEKVFVINLPERSDKRDAMTLATSLTNISVEYVDGIKGESVPDKALPRGAELRLISDNMIGSWRAHMNTIRSVMEKGYSSALIIEDDADWDIRIKQQLAQFAIGARWLQDTSETDSTRSPYGDDWDVLWVGHCVDSLDPTDPRTFVIEGDVSAADPRQLFKSNEEIPSWIADLPPHSRIVHNAKTPICTFAYAVSRRGAQRLLYNLAVNELQGNFDNALAWMCQAKAMGARCLSVYPSLFHQHRAAGIAGKNSDNLDSTPELTEAHTDRIQWPTKMNIEKLLRGETNFVDQFPDKPEAAA